VAPHEYRDETESYLIKLKRKHFVSVSIIVLAFIIFLSIGLFIGSQVILTLQSQPKKVKRQTDVRDRLISDAIYSLRQALLWADRSMRTSILYAVGKAYFHKGPDYHDDAIQALERSIADGYTASDIWEYLALAQYTIGLTSQSLENFERAIANAPGSSELLLAAATAAHMLKLYEQAEGLALDAALVSQDVYIQERIMFLLGDIYLATGRVQEALDRYEAIKSKNPESADAWYHEGVALVMVGDPIRARAAWRKAIAIDPMHTLSRQKLAERF